MLKKITIEERKIIDKAEAEDLAERIEELHDLSLPKNRETYWSYWEPEDQTTEDRADAELDFQDRMFEQAKAENRGEI